MTRCCVGDYNADQVFILIVKKKLDDIIVSYQQCGFQPDHLDIFKSFFFNIDGTDVF